MRIVVLLFLSLLMAVPAWAAPAQADYLLGPGDVVKISVYDNLDLSTTARVGNDGRIQFPLVGAVPVLGLSVQGVSNQIKTLLADGYLVDPQVTVFVDEYRSQKVVIVGHVRNPGVQELSGPTNLLELISMAGGLGADAGDRVTINRKQGSGGETEVLRVDLKRLLETGAADLNLQVQDGDNIFIAKAGMFYVTGQVKSPNAYKFENGTTILKAISMAGGFSPIAAESRVRVIRIIDGKETVLGKVSMQEPVVPDDVIVVPESFF